MDRYPNVSEVAARARTYLTVADARLRTELALPRDADSLYDRGVIELKYTDADNYGHGDYTMFLQVERISS